MIIARIEFKPGRGVDFCESCGQDIVEMRFESAEALMDTLYEFEEAIYDCLAFVNGKMVHLRSPGKKKPKPKNGASSQ